MIDEELKEVETDDEEVQVDAALGDGEGNAEGIVEESVTADTDNTEDTVEGEETIVSFGDESEEDEGGTEWIKKLRQKNRDQNKRIRELEHAQTATVEAASPLGERPTLEGAEYDAEVYESNLEEWLGQKAEFEQQEQGYRQHVENRDRAYQTRLDEYEAATTNFEKNVYKDAQDAVQEAFSPNQQVLMVHVAGSKAADMVMAFARDEKELKKVAAITDEHLFAAAIARLEAKVTKSKKKPKVDPEIRVVSSGGGASSSSHLEKLREKAAKTNDYTEVIRYKAQLRKEAS